MSVGAGRARDPTGADSPCQAASVTNPRITGAPSSIGRLGRGEITVVVLRGTAVLLPQAWPGDRGDRKSTRLNSSHVAISYAVFCLKKKKHKSTAMMSTV